METETYTFRVSGYDKNCLLPQISKALEKRTECISRERYPGIWAAADHLQHRSRGKKRSRLRTRVLSILCLAAGIFLVVPGLLSPQELFLPLLAGAAAVVIGAAGLWGSRKKKRNPFDRSAELLLEGKDTIIAEPPITVAFSEEGMTIPTDHSTAETVPYRDFECVVETVDLFLLVYGQRVTVLQKKDLISGNSASLAKLLAGKVTNYQCIVGMS